MNEEYERRAREQRARDEQVAAQRKWQEDYARSQAQQREENNRRAEKQRVRNEGFWEGSQGKKGGPGFYSGPHASEYYSGKAAGENHHRTMEQLKNIGSFGRPSSSGFSAKSGGGSRSGSSSPRGNTGSFGKFVLFVFAVIAILAAINSFKNNSSQSSSSSYTGAASAQPAIGNGESSTAATPKSAEADAQSQADQTSEVDPSHAGETSASTHETASAAHEDIAIPVIAPSSPATSALSGNAQPDVASSSTAIETQRPVFNPLTLLPNFHPDKGGAFMTPDSTPWPQEAQAYFASHKGHDGCDGRLVLMRTGLQFQCPSNPKKNFTVALGEIAKTDNDGIELISGKKYHFSMPGMNEWNTHVFFNGWIYRAAETLNTQ